MQKLLRKSLVVTGLALGAAIIGQNASADPADTLRWQSVIGMVQGGNVVGTGTGAVTGGPTPWSTESERVSVDLDNGRFNFSVRGLVLAGANSIGTFGAGQQDQRHAGLRHRWQCIRRKLRPGGYAAARPR